MQTMLGSRGAGIRGLPLADYRGRAELQGAEAGAGAMNRVREGDGKGVTGDAPPNPVRIGKMGVGTRWR